MKKIILVTSVMVILLSALSLNAQTFTLVTENFNDIDHGIRSKPAITDIDGDGLLDLLYGEYAGQIWHYEQDSENSLVFNLVTGYWNEIDVGGYATPTFTDLDGDGLLDLLIGELYGKLWHYEQDSAGSASFTQRTTAFNGIDVGLYSDPIFGDIDGDGLLDLLISKRYDGEIFYYEQSSEHSTSFSLVTSDLLPDCSRTYISLGIADIDGDGLLDLLVGEYYGKIHHYEQNSTYSTSFTCASTDWQSHGDLGGAIAPMFVDLDGDNYLDLILGQGAGHLNHYESDLMIGGSLDAPANVIISHNGTNVTIGWDAVDGAATYKIYNDTDPYGTFTYLEVEGLTSPTWSAAEADPKMFYHVIAVD